jgi:Icc-related predicted phosphoesterase
VIKVLSLSDEVDALIYSPRVGVLYRDVDLVIGCGDLPGEYLDYVVCHINRPLYYVEGNHVQIDDEGQVRVGSQIHGGIDLHRRVKKQVIRDRQILLAGVAGSLDYHGGPYHYSHRAMWLHVFSLLPGLWRNRARYGRYLDLFVTHAPPWGIHDQHDLPHRGIKAFHWFDRVFQPRYHIHGHIHYYRPDTVFETQMGRTTILNTFRVKKIEFDL